MMAPEPIREVGYGQFVVTGRHRLHLPSDRLVAAVVKLDYPMEGISFGGSLNRCGNHGVRRWVVVAGGDEARVVPGDDARQGLYCKVSPLSVVIASIP